jgi:hypothetical protein
MATKRDLQKMSIEDLTNEIVRLGNEREKIREEQAKVSAVRDEKLQKHYAEQLANAIPGTDAAPKVKTQTIGVKRNG